MTILLVAEHVDGVLSEHTRRAVTAALEIGGDIAVLVAGHNCLTVAEKAACIQGVSKVLLAEAQDLAHGLAEPLADLVVALSSSYPTVLVAGTAFGRNFMPRVAALLDVMQVSDVIAIEGLRRFRRAIYAGNAVETLQCLSERCVLTIRTSSFAAAGDGASAPIETVAAQMPTRSGHFLSFNPSISERPQLGSASVVVSGGRGVGSREAFESTIFPLADALGAAVGASRAAVDAGFAPNDWQVGQTGKIVAPGIYIAVGISGAIQHLAGMKDSKLIVAIDKNADAPIFEIADIGIVGDLFTIVPELTRLLSKS